MPQTESDTREKLILAGISEIDRNGIQDFSMRQVAADCGVSCAAPYKHFRNRNDFILAVFRYINERWYEVQSRVTANKTLTNTRETLTETCMAYIHFLLDHPNYRTIILLPLEGMSEEHRREKAQLSIASQMLIHRYCEEVHMPPETEKRKVFIARSLIYGAALMMDNGELEPTEENLTMVRGAIDREFDLN